MALSTLYLLNFNQYYNRQVKGANYTLEDYMEYVVYGPFARINFNPADGIATQQDINTADSNYNYLLVVDEAGDIESRWFVIQATRNLAGQYRLSLHRDLIVDYYEKATGATCYVERAMLRASDPLIFNSEGMYFNQIKKQEVLLKDETQSAWIVGYLSNNYYEGIAADGAIYFTRNIERTPTAEASYSELMELVNLNNGTIYTEASQNNQDLQFVLQNDAIYYGWGISQQQGQISQTENNSVICNSRSAVEATELIRRLQKAKRYFIGIQTLKNYIPGFRAYNTDLKSLNGQFIRNTDTSGPAYFSVNFELQELTTYAVTPAVGSDVYLDVKNTIYNLANSYRDNLDYVDLSDDIYFNDANINTIRIMVPCSKYKLTVSAQPPLLKARTILGNSEETKKRSLIDAPFTMFCMPASNINVYSSADSVEFTSEGNVCREMGAAISAIMGGSTGSSYIYDLQLLPYCPIQNIVDSRGRIDLSAYQSNTYAYITSQDSQGNYTAEGNCGIILFAPSSSFRKSISLSSPIQLPSDATQLKIDSETKFCRLVSPNYSGAFEFTPVKNGGVSSFEVNCTYKPFTPYIEVNPLFNQGYLYGGDFDDNRGLICGGDFSLPQTTDAWTKFQIENRSYLEAHNRQVENMETTHEIEMRQMKTAQWASGVSGTIQGGTSGALVGSAFGPIGAAVGAGVGAAAAAIANVAGASADLRAAEELHNEAVSYVKDQFKYSLQNIQALPTTMSRTSAFDINNKLFPFVEFYEATDREVEALRKKIQYNSMTVMAIGTVGEYIQDTPSYISAQLIRIDDLDEDYHLATAIAGELHKGIYI